MKAILPRFYSDNVQTLGEMLFYNEKGRQFDCKILELPDRNNALCISRINADTYWVEVRESEAHKLHFHIKDVEGRTLILLHSGNYFTDTEGCQLPGTSFKDINNDGHVDVRWSRNTLDKILKIAPKGFWLTIVDLDRKLTKPTH